METLKFIASYDDTIQFCETDTKLGEKYKSIFAGKEGRMTTFDPIMTAASNPTLLSDKHVDIWTVKGSSVKRGLNAFDEEKFTKLFIKRQKTLLDQEDQTKLVRSGFDAYAYLMAYEDEIHSLYGSRDLTKLQKAALYYVETGKEEVELDYIRYIASYDDLVLGTVSGNVENKPWEEFIPTIGKLHYDTAGRNEIATGVRPVTDFFNATQYIATYFQAQDFFKADDGTLDEKKIAIVYITIGASNGYVRNGFNHNIFLANYPELLEEDIYVDKEISPIKVAKLWLVKVKDGIDLSKFDALDFKESNGLDDVSDAFVKYVQVKKAEYLKMLKKKSKLFYRLGASLCGVSKLNKM